MNNLFIYENPHPAHRVFAESIDCYIPPRPTRSTVSIPDRIKRSGLYRHFTRTPFIVRYAIEKTSSGFVLPDRDPDIVLFEGWRQLKIAKKFPNSFRVLIGGDWYPLVFAGNKKMLSYYEDMDMIVSVSDLHKSCLPDSVKERTHIVHPSFDLNSRGIASGNDCVFIGNVYERVKRIDLSIKVFRSSFGKGQEVSFNIVGPRGGGFRKDNNIYFWGSIGRGSDLFHNILMGSRYYIHWAEHDPHPVTVMEAMSYGVIPITSPMTGNHYLTTEVSGDIHPCETMDDACELIRILENDEDLLDAVRQRCIDASKRYIPEVTGSAFRKVVLKGFIRSRS